MALFNYATKEITLKTVYYGPGLSGKTTNLQYLHSILNPESTGKLLSLATDVDRTLFFDFLPIKMGKLRDFSIRFQLYTVPGQVRYNATRKLVLKGADAVCFVADSQVDMREQNIESFENMFDNLRVNNINPDDIPIVIQYNKRDLKNILSVEALNKDLNPNNIYDHIEASAINGTGVEDSYKLITKLLLKNIASKHKLEIFSTEEAVAEEEKHPEITVQPEVPPVIHAEEPMVSNTVQEEPERVPEYELNEEVEEAISADQAYTLTEEISLKERSFPDTEFSHEKPESVPEYELSEEAVEATNADRAYTLTEEILHEKKEDASTKEREEVIDDSSAAAYESAAQKASEMELTPEYSLDEFNTAEETATIPEPFDIEKEALTEEETDEVITKEVTVISGKNIESMVRELGEISTLLKGFKDSLNSLNSTVVQLNREIRNMRDSIEIKELKELKEIKREQKETNALLKSIETMFDKLKIKKSWFRF